MNGVETDKKLTPMSTFIEQRLVIGNIVYMENATRVRA